MFFRHLYIVADKSERGVLEVVDIYYSKENRQICQRVRIVTVEDDAAK
jgi:hypothetical protein